jgi:hypothetical protein
MVSKWEGYKRCKVVANHCTGCLVYGIRWSMDFHEYEPLLRRSGWDGGYISWQPLGESMVQLRYILIVLAFFLKSPTKTAVSQKALISRSPMEVAVARAGCNGPAPPHHHCEYQYIHLRPQLFLLDNTTREFLR